MPKTGTYALIDSNTLGSAQASITFSSIPATFTDLIIIAFVKSINTGTNTWVRFNSDTATNYSLTRIFGSNSGVSSARYNATRIYDEDYDTATSAINIINIMDYCNTNTFKSTIGRGNTPTQFINLTAGIWRSTSAINSITYGIDSGNMDVGSSFYLYGIQAGNA